MGKYKFWSQHRITGDSTARGIPSQDGPACITVEEAASYLRMNPQSIRRYIRAGRLIAWDCGCYYRIPLDEWEAFLDRCLTQAVDVEWLTSGQVMRLLNIGKGTFYKLTESGQLPSYKILGMVRVTRSDLAAWLMARRRGQRGKAVDGE